MGKKDFFISRAGEDRDEALYIADILQRNGYSVIIQDNDFRPGDDFIEKIDEALMTSERLIAIYSEAYFQKGFCKAEWRSAFGEYATGMPRAIIPIRITGVNPGDYSRLLKNIIYIDLHKMGIDKWEEELLRGVGGKNKTEVPVPGNQKGVIAFHNLPHGRNVYFTGREGMLEYIKQNFSSDDRILHSQAICGLGGVGKSSVALEYAYRYMHRYETIWWINAESRSSALLCYYKFLSAKKIVFQSESENDILEEMKYWLSTHDNWLFIYDNADADDYNRWLELYMPKGGNGDAIVTTRSKTFPKCKSIDVSVFDEGEAVSFLARRSGKEGNGYAYSSARDLVARLQYLPLAIEQAAAYICEGSSVTYLDYINLLAEHGVGIFDNEAYVVDYLSTVSATWEISMSRIRNKDAAELFYLCAYLASDRIPVDMFIRGNSSLPEQLQSALNQGNEIDVILNDLTRYSLMKSERGDQKSSRDGRLLYVHRLVQEVIQKKIGPDFSWLGYCLEMMASISDWDSTELEGIMTFRSESAHALSVAEKAYEVFASDCSQLGNVGKIFFDLAGFSEGLRNLDVAQHCISRCKEITSKRVREEGSLGATLDLLFTSMNRGTIYVALLEYEKAIDEYSEAVSIGEDIALEGSYDVTEELARVHMNRGVAYEYLKKYECALQEKNKSIELYERLCMRGSFQADNSLALAYMNRGVTYESLQRYSESLADCDRSIEIWEKMKSDGKKINENNLAKARGNKGVLDAKVRGVRQGATATSRRLDVRVAEAYLRNRKKKED